MRLYAVLFALCLSFSALLSAQEPADARVRVTCTPAATLTVDYKKCGYGESFLLTLPPGKPVLLKVDAAGYEPIWRTVTPKAGESRTEVFRSVRRPIPVLFRSEPESLVLLDGAELGRTPLRHFFSEPRSYNVVFRAPGFREQRRALDLSDGKPQVVDTELASDSGCVTVSSEPEGAELFLNGVLKGKTPQRLDRLLAGSYELTLRLPGYYPVEHGFRVAAGAEVPFTFRMERLPAGLTVTTRPTGARIFLDGAYQGVSTLTVRDVAPGTYRLRAELPNHAAAERTVTLRSGDVQAEDLELAALHGTLALQTKPARVEIWIDGKKLAVTVPASKNAYHSAVSALSLSPGVKTLTLKAHGYADYTEKVTVMSEHTLKKAYVLTFKPDFVVYPLVGAAAKGVLKEQADNGNITIEIKPGLFRTYRREDIQSARFITH